MKALDFTPANGVSMRAIVTASDPDRMSDEPTVRFFDRRFPRFGQNGQFICEYYVSTLLGSPWLDRGGLMLYGGVPDWTIDGETFQDAVMPFIRDGFADS